MRVPVYDIKGNQIDEAELRDEIFAAEINEPLMHQALLRQLANARLGTHKTKTRGEVRGGGRKPYRQKGTGHARQGSTRAPHWPGGGTVFGPTPRSYEQRMPRKMRRQALRSALSVKAAGAQLKLLDSLDMVEPRTKAMIELLGSLGCEKSALILMPHREDSVWLSARNLPQVKTLVAHYLNVRDLLHYDTIIVPLQSLHVIESILGQAEVGEAQ